MNPGGLWINLQGAAVSQQRLREFLLLKVVVSLGNKFLFASFGVSEASGQEQADLQSHRHQKHCPAQGENTSSRMLLVGDFHTMGVDSNFGSLPGSRNETLM